MADSNLVDFRSNTTFGRIYSFADDFKNSAGVINLDEQLRLDRQRFADHAAGRAPLPPKESLALRDRIEKTTKLLNPAAQNVWGVLSEAELAWQDEVKAASRKFANTIGMLAGGPALAVLPASGRMLGASEDIIEKLAEVNAGAASVLGIPKPASLPWVHPTSGRLVRRSADLSQPLYGRRADDLVGRELARARSHPGVSGPRVATPLDMQGTDGSGKTIYRAEHGSTRTEPLSPKKSQRKREEKKKKAAKAGTFVAKPVREPTVTAVAEVSGQIFKGTNQKARLNRDPNHPTAAADKIMNRRGYSPGDPNTSMYNAHAEVEAMQLAHEAGAAYNADMVIRLTGQEVCGYCRYGTIFMAESIGLKSLKIIEPQGTVLTWTRNGN